MQRLVLQSQSQPLNDAPAPRDQLNFEVLLHYLEKVVPALVEEAEADEDDGDDDEQKKEVPLSERLAQFRNSISLEIDLDLAQSVVGAESGAQRVLYHDSNSLAAVSLWLSFGLLL